MGANSPTLQILQSRLLASLPGCLPCTAQGSLLIPGAGEPRGCPLMIASGGQPSLRVSPLHPISGPLTAMVTTVRSAKAVITTFWRMFSCQVRAAAVGLPAQGVGSGLATGPVPMCPQTQPCPLPGALVPTGPTCFPAFRGWALPVGSSAVCVHVCVHAGCECVWVCCLVGDGCEVCGSLCSLCICVL